MTSFPAKEKISSPALIRWRPVEASLFGARIARMVRRCEEQADVHYGVHWALDALANNRLTLWTAPGAMFATCVADYDRPTLCVAYFDGSLRAARAVWPLFRREAAALGYRQLVYRGRRGWRRALPGWRSTGVDTAEAGL